MSVNSKMTAIADEIRELSGTTGTMGLDAMTNTLHTENTNFASNLTNQDNLIAQIQTALESKATPSGGEDVSAETNAYTSKLATLETAITALETELQGKASGGNGANFETSVVTLNTFTECRYLGIDFQPKSETTSTFETVKNSIVFIAGTVVGGSGYTTLPSQMGATVVQLTESTVNITLAGSGGSE